MTAYFIQAFIYLVAAVSSTVGMAISCVVQALMTLSAKPTIPHWS